MPTPRKTIDELPEQGVLEDDNLLIVHDGGTTKKMTIETLKAIMPDPLMDHLSTLSAAHSAYAIVANDSGNGINGGSVQLQLQQLAAGVGDSGGGTGIVIDDAPPSDTDVLWADTSDSSIVAPDTVNVFTYTDETDLRPDATVVFWIPDPYTLDDPFGALAGDLVLRTTPDVVQGVNGITGLWQGTAAAYEALPAHDATTVYFIIA